jgi:magnesium transporter
MFRVIEVAADGKAGATATGDALVGPPIDGARRFIDLLMQDPAELALLGERFGFHPLTLEDCAHRDQRPKLEHYGSYAFIVTQGFESRGDRVDGMRWHELHAFLGADYLVAVHLEPIPAFDAVFHRVAEDPVLLSRGADFVYYLIADRMVDDSFPVLDRVADALEDLEDVVVTRPRREQLTQIFDAKRQLVMMRKVLSPQRDVIGALARPGEPMITEQTALYLRDVYDHLARIVESIEAQRDLLGNALDAYLSATGQRTNEIMKALAILSAVFMPLTFITGFFGQNFEQLPFGSDLVLTTTLASLALTPAALLFWFKSRHWF